MTLSRWAIEMLSQFVYVLQCRSAGREKSDEMIMTMQLKTALGAAPHDPDHQHFSVHRPSRYGWSMFDCASSFDFALAQERYQANVPQPLSGPREGAPTVGLRLIDRSTDVALPVDKTIAISVIKGPSKGLTRRFSKRRISIGCASGEADFKIDDPEISHLHCAIDASPDLIRLYDLGSANGTYVNDEPVQSVEIQHLSEFRVGSSLLLLLILPKPEMDAD